MLFWFVNNNIIDDQASSTFERPPQNLVEKIPINNKS